MPESIHVQHLKRILPAKSEINCLSGGRKTTAQGKTRTSISFSVNNLLEQDFLDVYTFSVLLKFCSIRFCSK